MKTVKRDQRNFTRKSIKPRWRISEILCGNKANDHPCLCASNLWSRFRWLCVVFFCECGSSFKFTVDDSDVWLPEQVISNAFMENWKPWPWIKFVCVYYVLGWKHVIIMHLGGNFLTTFSSNTECDTIFDLHIGATYELWFLLPVFPLIFTWHCQTLDGKKNMYFVKFLLGSVLKTVK